MIKPSKKILIALMTLITVIILWISLYLYNNHSRNFIDGTYSTDVQTINDGAMIASTFRYTYPFEINIKDENGKNKVLEISLDYDYIPLSEIDEFELNEIIKMNVEGIENIYKNSTYGELTSEEGYLKNLNDVVSYTNSIKDDKVFFVYSIGAYGGDTSFYTDNLEALNKETSALYKDAYDIVHFVNLLNQSNY